MNTRRTLISSGTVILIVGILCGSPVWFVRYRVKSYDKAFNAITRGMSQANVITAMGKPHAVEMRGAGAFWDDEPLGEQVEKQITTEYRYMVNVGYMPVVWAVGFDANGRVISKHRYD